MSATPAPTPAAAALPAENEPATAPLPTTSESPPIASEPNGSDSAPPSLPSEPQEPPSPAAPEATTAASDRAAAAARMIESAALPPVLRERFTQLVQAAETSVDGRALLPLESCLRAIEESLPSFLRQSPPPKTVAHPTGDVFFRGQADELSDSEAEEVARQQLARSGLLRGQRARVD